MKNRSLTTCFVFVLVTLGLKGQYTFTTLTGQTYTEITNPTYEIPDNSQYWGNVNTKTDMYFTSFGSVYDLYDNVYIPLKQGYIYFINQTRSTTIYRAKGLFDGRPGANQTSVFSFALDTVNSEQVFILQWKNTGFENGDENDFINFQIRLYENSGIIEMCFGPNAVKNGLWENNANGPTVGLLEMDNTFSTIHNRMWLTATPQSPIVSNTGTFLQMTGTPADGTVYRFIPTTTGIQPIEATGFKIYPTVLQNNDAITLQKPQGNEHTYTARLLSSDGRVLTSQSFATANTQLSTESLQPGVYIVIVEYKGTPVATTRVVKID